ncbi:MAG: hypothetical protein ACO1N7_12395, partial [Sphingobacteriaceae bacterium]
MKRILIFNILLMNCIVGFTQSKSFDTSKQVKRNYTTYIPSEEPDENSLAVIVDEVPLAHTTQFYPIDRKGKLLGINNLSEQVDQVFKNITSALKAGGAKTEDIV